MSGPTAQDTVSRSVVDAKTGSFTASERSFLRVGLMGTSIACMSTNFPCIRENSRRMLGDDVAVPRPRGMVGHMDWSGKELPTMRRAMVIQTRGARKHP